jgi:hypothetical protein
MRDKRKKSALKGGPTVSTTRSFEGAHPDGGTMKIFVQVCVFGLTESRGGLGQECSKRSEATRSISELLYNRV